MGINTLPSRADGVPMPNTWFSDIHTAIKLDWVPRNASGIPESDAGSVGTVDYPWLNGRFSNIYLEGNLVDPGTVTGKPHRIVSAAQDGTTRYPEFLDPAGVAGGLSCDLLATATAFGAVINNVQTDVTADTTFSALTAAPAANNTCAIDDLALAGAASTKELGEFDNKELTIDNVGTEISDRKGEIHAFLRGTEIFLAEIDTDNNRLLPIFRGWAGTDRSVLSNNDSITLLSMNVLLFKNDGSAKVASLYFPESVTTSPAAGTAGKIYIERDTNKIGYDTGAAIDYSYMIVGYAICDDTDCTNAQIYDMELSWASDINAEYQISDTDATAIKIQREAQLSVNGQKIVFTDNYTITQAANMDAGEAIAASTQFYIYMREDGSAVFSTVRPRKFDSIKKGHYHPLKYFRCIGSIFSEAGNDWLFKRAERKNPETIRDEMVPVGSIIAWTGGYYTDGSNGGFTSVLGNTIAAFKAILPDNWKACDGSEIFDVESPIFNATGRYIENLTDDRFLMGDTVCGAIGGSNDANHNHVMAHHHVWGYHDTGTNELHTRTTGDSAVVSMSVADTKLIYHIGGNTAGGAAVMQYTGSCPTSQLYTTGVLDPPLGAAGNTAATQNAAIDNRPVFLTCFYIRKIK